MNQVPDAVRRFSCAFGQGFNVRPASGSVLTVEGLDGLQQVLAPVADFGRRDIVDVRVRVMAVRGVVDVRCHNGTLRPGFVSGCR